MKAISNKGAWDGLKSLSQASIAENFLFVNYLFMLIED